MKIIVKDNIKIENMIYEIRGRQVMLDSDLAKLYQVETKRINEAVKRNMEKFPDRFSWILEKTEDYNLKSQIATSSLINEYGGRRKLPRVFTEQGVAMLATILKTPIATQVSINIMDAFVLMKKYISNNLIEQRYINDMVIKHDVDIKLLQDSFNKFNDLTNEIYFEGQIYDAYSKIIDIMSIAKKELIIIDSYADKKVLDMISKIKVPTTLIIKEKGLLNKLDIEKYQKQYNNLKVIYNNTFHDRYILIDKEIIYHCGTSLNHARNKTFSINKLEEDIVKNSLFEKIDSLTK